MCGLLTSLLHRRLLYSFFYLQVRTLRLSAQKVVLDSIPIFIDIKTEWVPRGNLSENRHFLESKCPSPRSFSIAID